MTDYPQIERVYFPALDIFRIFAFGLVALNHMIVIEAKYAGDTLLFPEMIFGISGVDLFFILSGFMMGRLFLIQPDASRPKPQKFILDRISRIYPLYWLITVMLTLLLLIAPNMVFSAREYEPDIIPSLFLWPTDAMPLHLVGWTLEHMMFFYIVTMLILMLKRRWLAPSLLIWASVTIALYHTPFHRINPVTELISHPYSLEYISAMAVALLPITGKRLASALLILSAILIAIPVIWFGTQGIDIRTIPPLHRVLAVTPGGLLMIYALSAWRGKNPSNKWISLAGFARAGFALYLTHVLVLSLLGRIWAKFANPNSLWDNFVILPLMFAACFMIAMITERYFESPVAKLIRGLDMRRPAWR